MQVLFAFLLTVPFAAGLRATSRTFQTNVYFVDAAVLGGRDARSSSRRRAYHRLNFRQRDKQHIVTRRLAAAAIVGIGLLALAMTGAVLLVTDYLFGDDDGDDHRPRSRSLFAVLWFVLPLARRMSNGD